jgi:hypothetical protein
MPSRRWTCPDCAEPNLPELPRCLRCKGYRPKGWSEIPPPGEHPPTWQERLLAFLRRER